ncbi:MAG: hypothetical protein V5A68_07590 [Candidatus Thermoplasmatota archaeon]
MGCNKLKTNVKLDYIQDFEMMFERMKLKRPREAAIYYVTMVIDNPKEFSTFLDIADELANITRRPLETGRSCLLKAGIIAKVLFSKENNEEFGRESFLPVHPKAIWENIKDDLKKFIAEDTYKSIKKRMENYTEYYLKNFEKYGIKLKRNGNVTLQYSGKWILYNILQNALSKKDSLKLQIGGDHFFKQPYINYFKKLLDLDTDIQLIMDTDIDRKTAEKLIEEYGDKLDIRYFSHEDIHGTMRNCVFGKELAVNGVKILPDGGDEPSYVGTAYVQLDDIEQLNSKFKTMWDIAKPLKN